MTLFHTRVQNQKKKDFELYTQTVEDIYSTIDASCKTRQRSKTEEKERYIVEELEKYFHLKPVEVTGQQSKKSYLDAGLELLHIRRRFVVLKENWWKEDALPLLVMDSETREEKLLLPGKWGSYLYYNEKTGKKKRVTKDTAALFGKEAYCLYPPFAEGTYTERAFWLALMKAYSFSDWMMVILITFIVTVMGLVVPYVNQYIFDIVIPSGAEEDIVPMAALLFGVVITSALFRMLRSIWIYRTGDRGRIWLESGIWNHILGLPMRFYKKYEAGDLSDRIFLLMDACKVVWENLIPALQTILFSVMYLFQVGLLAGELLFTSCKILLAVVLVQCIFALLHMKINKRHNEINARLSGFLYQVYSGIRKIKLCGAETRVFAKWASLYKQQSRIHFVQPFLVKYSRSILQAIIMAGTYFIYLRSYKTQISISDYISFQVAYGSLLATVLSVGGVGEQLALIRPAFKMTAELLAQEEESTGIKKKITHLEGNIELSNISFRYATELDYVLNNFTLSIKKGEYVAVTGASGCGKSTLFRLLLGFERPETGIISYDSQDIESLDIQSIRKCIGSVLQNDKIFDGDIFSNISLCAPDITMEEAWEAAERAGVAEDIQDMPMGMFTMISENGGGLSGGQKQRILIARVLAMNPDVLLFDEATSALDNVTQAKVTNALNELKSTRIVIAHRLSTIRSCDRVIYLQGGRILEEGTYEELIALDGEFAKLAKRQLA